MQDYPEIALPGVISPLPALFLDCTRGHIIWFVNENWCPGFMGRALYYNFFLWNGKAQMSLCLGRFGLN